MSRYQLHIVVLCAMTLSIAHASQTEAKDPGFGPIYGTNVQPRRTASDEDLGLTQSDTAGLPAAPVRAAATLPQPRPPILSNGGAVERFGSELFTGAFSSPGSLIGSEEWQLSPGDRVEVAIAGALNMGTIALVDGQGDIFVPQIGTVRVEGSNARELELRIRAKASQIFATVPEIYVRPLGVQPIGVFVTGHVARPGMYPGAPGETALHYLDRAGGIARNGSFRMVSIQREGKTIVSLDLYDFLLKGSLPPHALRRGDTIVVGPAGPLVETAQPRMQYELTPSEMTGAGLIALARPEARTTRVTLTGLRRGNMRSQSMALGSFGTVPLQPGDSISFSADAPIANVRIFVEGATIGPATITLPRGASLGDALDRVEVDPNVANIRAIQVRRASVARQQKAAIAAALTRLQDTVLNTRSTTTDEALMRAKEAELVDRFVEKVKQVEPKGTIVIANASPDTLPLEDGDVVVVPPKSGVVAVHGEVATPGAFAYDGEQDVDPYIELAGGPTRNANPDLVLVAKVDGRTLKASETSVEPGDEILVLPAPSDHSFQLGKDMMQILYQIAVSSRILLTI